MKPDTILTALILITVGCSGGGVYYSNHHDIPNELCWFALAFVFLIEWGVIMICEQIKKLKP